TIGTGVILPGAKVADQHRAHPRVIEGITAPKSVRHKTQSPPSTEINDAAERAVELLERTHGDRVHHLLVELRVRFRRLESVLHRDVYVIEIDGLEPDGRGGSRVYINDFN